MLFAHNDLVELESGLSALINVSLLRDYTYKQDAVAVTNVITMSG